MATAAHVLIATDTAWRDFLISRNIAGLAAAKIVRNKESAGKELPILIGAADNATRKRTKNWEVTGSLLLKTDCTGETEQETAAALDASAALETAVLEAIEGVIPIDDRPQPLADAITAAVLAAASLPTGTFMMTACVINRVSAGFDEDEIWTFSVDYTATVIA